jgi:type IV pilus assembly protein PilA
VKRLTDTEDGFTLVELLVVIFIVGILAAIAVPVLLGQQHKGQDASAKSDARNAVAQVETCFVDERAYDRCNDAADAALYDSEIDWGKIDVATDGIGTDLFRVDARSGSGNSFLIAKTDDGRYVRSCTTAGRGACTSDGDW